MKTQVQLRWIYETFSTIIISKWKELSSEEIPDDILQQFLLDSIQENELLPQKETSSNARADEKNSSNLSSRFKSITKEYVDEIGNKSVQKKTHKQTTWGVKIFRGT